MFKNEVTHTTSCQEASVVMGSSSSGCLPGHGAERKVDGFCGALGTPRNKGRALVESASGRFQCTLFVLDFHLEV